MYKNEYPFSNLGVAYLYSFVEFLPFNQILVSVFKGEREAAASRPKTQTLRNDQIKAIGLKSGVILVYFKAIDISTGLSPRRFPPLNLCEDHGTFLLIRTLGPGVKL